MKTKLLLIIIVLLQWGVQLGANTVDTVKKEERVKPLAKISVIDSAKIKRSKRLALRSCDIIRMPEKQWKAGLLSSFTFSNVNLIDWAAGGENSTNTMAILNGFANYKDSVSSWENSLDAGFGMVKSGENDFRKNDDKFEMNSKYGRLANRKFKVYYSTLINFKSQFRDGFNYPNDSVPVSRFLTPAYLTAAIGLDYKPADYFSLYASPATLKLIIVNDQILADDGAFGVEPAQYDPITKVKITNGQLYKNQVGSYMRARFQREMGPDRNVNVMTTLNLFNNYTDENIVNRKNVDVNWETTITIKLGRFLATSLYTNIIYDDNIIILNKDGSKSPKLQFKEVLGIGLSYRINS